MLRPFVRTLVPRAAFLPPGTAPAAGPAQRIVSLNLCTDELLLRLADPARIASVTWLSRNPGSNVPDLAARVPINHGLAEQVLSADPDLVLAGPFPPRITIGMLKRATTIPVVEFAPPRNFDEVRRQILDIAGLV